MEPYNAATIRFFNTFNKTCDTCQGGISPRGVAAVRLSFPSYRFHRGNPRYRFNGASVTSPLPAVCFRASRTVYAVARRWLRRLVAVGMKPQTMPLGGLTKHPAECGDRAFGDCG